MAAEAGGGTRLDRLLKLLDTGSTPARRQHAARQIGDIAKQHSVAQLPNVIQRIARYLRSSSWETRIAASQAIGAIAENVPHATVKDVLAFSGWSGETVEGSRAEGSLGLTFEDFDIGQVLEQGAPLLASQGKEYDIDESRGTHSERVQRARRNLRKRLGLDGEGGLGDIVDLNEMVPDADLLGPSTTEA
eukprot:4197627-Pyramimonas_sp.AAC.1